MATADPLQETGRGQGSLPTVLVVEDNPKLARLFAEALSTHFQVEIAPSLDEARRLCPAVQGVLLDLQLPDGDGLTLIPHLMETNPACAVVVVTAYGTIPRAVEAIRLGAAEFLEKPVDLEGLLQTFRSLLPSGEPGEMVAESPAMREIAALIQRVAATDFPVLISGETGVGKEVVARAIHRASGRERFVALNCAAIPRELAESLLFGHRKGAFTGAGEGARGLVETAHHGTLFLDEIGEMDLELQPKLLRFLDTGSFIPLGEHRERRSSARIVAATNRDLKALCREGRFREDLYYRLGVIVVEIPPLRERPQDLEALIRRHLRWLSAKLNRPLSLEPRAVELLRAYPFPGNVRELFNILDRAAILSPSTITAEAVTPLLERPEGRGPTAGAPGEAGLIPAAKEEAARKERELIERILQETGGNKAEAARRLRISYKTLYNKMKRLGLF